MDFKNPNVHVGGEMMAKNMRVGEIPRIEF
jgi:hypothetical protein